MELSHSLADAVSRPRYVLADADLRRCFDRSAILIGHPDWDLSPLNPKNRVDSLTTRSSRWRIDGATGCGTRYYAVPLDSHTDPTPLRIFVYLPDQTQWPPALRHTLDAPLSVPLRDGRAIANLGISRHICRALDYRCAADPGFLQRYHRLPFGSQLVFENVASNTADMRLTVVPNYQFERRTATVETLQKMWPEVPSDAWPPVVGVSSLGHVYHVHDTVSIVKAPGHDSTVVFKSSISSVDHMYHELRFLLTVPPHSNIMPPPLALVTKQTAFGGKRGVVGFLLRHFPAGSIRDILPARQRAATLSPRLKLAWCLQTAAALEHVRQAAGTFFSDLRPDNVLLDEDERVILCDFEQRGNWHEWCAPEVLFRQYSENIHAALPVPHLSSPYDGLLVGFALGSAPTSATPPVEAANRAWFMLSTDSQDKATVYSFGLFIYTVFEGLSSVRRSIANQWPIDPAVQFPEVRHTPAAVLKIVRRCTVDALEWTEGGSVLRPPRLLRIGGMLYPDRRTNLEQGTPETAAAVLDTALAWWSAELSRAEAFLDSDEWRTREFGFGRPSLQEVTRALEEIAEGELWK